MASIAKRPDGRWRARYRDASGKEYARHFKRKVDAQRWLDSVTVAIETGAYVTPRAGNVTVGEWSERWLMTKVDLKETTRVTYEQLLRKHVLPTWERAKLSEVNHVDVAAWVARLSAQGLSASTVRQTHRVLSLILGLAVSASRIARNPCAGVPLPRAARRTQRFLTPDQVEAIADGAGEYALAVRFLAYTGVRFGEMAALKVRNLDLLRRRAAIVEAMAEVRGRAVFSTPKTHQSRTVAFSRRLADELGSWIASKDPDDFVFTAPNGGVLRNRNFRRNVFDAAARSAGLDGLTPHELRHTAASLAIASGANVKVVQQMLGHKSATMTLDLYGHLFDDQLDAVAEAMDSFRPRADRPRTDSQITDLATFREVAGAQ
jgi:integrase